MIDFTPLRTQLANAVTAGQLAATDANAAAADANAALAAATAIATDLQSAATDAQTAASQAQAAALQAKGAADQVTLALADLAAAGPIVDALDAAANPPVVVVPPPPPTPLPPPPTTSNEPAGLTLIQDYPFPYPIPTAQYGALDPVGWGEAYNTGGLGSTSGGVFQVKYPAGYNGGGAPCTLYYDFKTKPSVLYSRFGWKPSNPWQNHPSNINKVLFIKFLANSTLQNSGLTMYWTGSRYELRFFPEFLAGWTYQPAPTGIVLGQRHLIETLTDTIGKTFKWWVDGVLQGTWSGAFPPGGVYEYSFSPTWGGLNGTKTETDYYWYDSLYLSGK